MSTRLIRRLTLTALVLAAILWNGWAIATFKYSYAAWSHMEISELSIRAQPWSWVFRSLDGLSALCMIAAAVGIVFLFRKAGRYAFRFTAILLIAMGLLTFFDVTHSLDCVQYGHPVCVEHVNGHMVSRSDNLHEAESRITSYTSIVLALWVVALSVRFGKSPTSVIASIGLAVDLIWSLIILNETHDLFTYAINDRLWNLFVSGDLLVIGYAVRERSAMSTRPVRRLA